MSSGQRPPTLAEAAMRGLLADDSMGIHTFSNGTEYEGWADGNCWSCWFWDEDEAGARCAFEAAAFLDQVSPALAALYGWTERSWAWRWLGKEKGQIKVPSYTPPSQCPFFRNRTDSDGDDNAPPPDPDPLQLVLIADPTEDAAMVTNAPSEAQELALTAASNAGMGGQG
jgi:hypothetical protein